MPLVLTVVEQFFDVLLFLLFFLQVRNCGARGKQWRNSWILFLKFVKYVLGEQQLVRRFPIRIYRTYMIKLISTSIQCISRYFCKWSYLLLISWIVILKNYNLAGLLFFHIQRIVRFKRLVDPNPRSWVVVCFITVSFFGLDCFLRMLFSYLSQCCWKTSLTVFRFVPTTWKNWMFQRIFWDFRPWCLPIWDHINSIRERIFISFLWLDTYPFSFKARKIRALRRWLYIVLAKLGFSIWNLNFFFFFYNQVII